MFINGRLVIARVVIAASTFKSMSLVNKQSSLSLGGKLHRTRQLPIFLWLYSFYWDLCNIHLLLQFGMKVPLIPGTHVSA
jgi:hypothetical protein